MGDHVPQRSERVKRLIGYACIVGLVVSWVAQAEVAQYVQTKGKFSNPYFIVWFNHGWMAFLVPIQMVWWRYYRPATSSSSWLQHVHTTYGISTKQLWKIGLGLTGVYFVADYVWYIGLPMTSVAAATAIFNSSCAFAYIFSIFMLGEAVLPLKIAALLVAVGGVVLIALRPGTSKASSKDEDTTGQQLLANILMVASAALYALYEVVFKKYAIKDLTEPSIVTLMTGYAGIANLLVVWPGIILVNYLPKSSHLGEPFDFPGGMILFWFIINGIMALAFNLFFMMAIAFTSPLITSVAIMLAIPVSFISDYFMHGDEFTWFSVGGSLLIIAGFGLLTYADVRHERERAAYLQVQQREGFVSSDQDSHSNHVA